MISPIQNRQLFREESRNQSISASNVQFELSHKQNDSLKQLKYQVQHNKSQLIELVNSNTFQLETSSLNRRGVGMIKQGLILEAIICICQAEKVLEFAANTGKQINRSLIVSVLHNLACCYQQTWNLQKCANYIEALIYNLNCQLKQTEDRNSDSSLVASQGISINRSLSNYYLLFCAINSQLKKNDAALIAARKGNHLLKNSSLLLYKLANKARMGTDQHLIQILMDLGRLKTSAQKLEVCNLLQIANQFLLIWRSKCSLPNFQLKSAIGKLKDFSIGNLMQIQPKDIKSNEQSIWNELSYEKVMERIVIISMSYFTMATQLRLLSQKLTQERQKLVLMSQFRQSQIYHLISIILLLYYIPFDFVYLQHILTSYHNHYGHKIQPSVLLSKRLPKELFQTLLESQDKQSNKISTEFNSDKDPSSAISRNSHENVKNCSAIKLKSYVRASLKSQKYDENQSQMAKLNNYYYIRTEKISQEKDKASSKSKKLSNHSKNASLKKRGCITSKQSAQKTPIRYSPVQLSPDRIKKLSKLSAQSITSRSKSKCLQNKGSPKMNSNIMSQYFNTQLESKVKKTETKRLKSKSKKNKQNHKKLSSNKVQQNRVSNWKASEVINKPEQLNRLSNEFKSLRSLGKLKSKLQGAKSKSKIAQRQHH